MQILDPTFLVCFRLSRMTEGGFVVQFIVGLRFLRNTFTNYFLK